MTDTKVDVTSVLNTIKTEIGETPTNAEGSSYVSPALYDQYMDNGTLDYVKVSNIFGFLIGKKQFEKAVNQVFGSAKFHTVASESTITKEEFTELYTFGRFPRVKDWQRAIYRESGKYIAIQDLYQWVLELG